MTDVTSSSANQRYQRAKIDIFSGIEKENVSDFLFLLETQFAADGLADRDKVQVAVSYLRGAPLAMYRLCIGASRLENVQNTDIDRSFAKLNIASD